MAIEVDEDAFDFGARLQKTRNLSGLTQEQLAKKLGISKQTISSYESNVKKPSILTARKLARALNCSLDYLLGLENSETIAIQDLRPGEREIILQYIRVFHTDKEPPGEIGIEKRMRGRLKWMFMISEYV